MHSTRNTFLQPFQQRERNSNKIIHVFGNKHLNGGTRRRLRVKKPSNRKQRTSIVRERLVGWRPRMRLQKKQKTSTMPISAFTYFKNNKYVLSKELPSKDQTEDRNILKMIQEKITGINPTSTTNGKITTTTTANERKKLFYRKRHNDESKMELWPILASSGNS